MSATLRMLIEENENPFELSLCAGQISVRNKVTWVYMLEDENTIPYFHGSELAVTTGTKVMTDPGWLMVLVEKLAAAQAAGLIINVGKFVFDIPADVIAYCNAHDFPLMTMPWEMKITEMTQSFCLRIIQEQHDSIAHDRAMADAIFRRGNESEYREILKRYYDLEGKFTVIMMSINSNDGDIKEASEMEDILLNRVRRFKTRHGITRVHFGLIGHENTELMILNNAHTAILPEVRNIIIDVFKEAADRGVLAIGMGAEVTGITQIYKSYHRARTAMRMAVYRRETFVRFEDMGFYKILFSVKDDELLYSYADEILAPLDSKGAQKQHYLELLKAYIQNDRSLEKTAADLYLHRNTVNYQIQKLKGILNSPLKTVEDLFPFQVALAILDMEPNREK